MLQTFDEGRPKTEPPRPGNVVKRCERRLARSLKSSIVVSTLKRKATKHETPSKTKAMGCCQSTPCPDPQYVGLWISDDATNRSNLLENHEYEKVMTPHGCSKGKRACYYKPCRGAVLEVSSSGHVHYLEMEGMWARTIYSGPITSWDGPDGTWTGCCVGCCCCKKGCIHFDVELPRKGDTRRILINGRAFSKDGMEESMSMIPIVTATPIVDHY